jgi:DNA-directed RNA polymerase III subunit RPC11
MWFCPLDGTLLQVRQGGMARAGDNEPSGYFFCALCPYSCPIKTIVAKKTYPTRKVVDDILGGAAAWENVDRTQAVCPSCNHNEAYFMQIQIRSADEPMSIFYKCVKCNHQWNDK